MSTAPFLKQKETCSQCICTHPQFNCECTDENRYKDVPRTHRFHVHPGAGIGATIYVGSDRYPCTVLTYQKVRGKEVAKVQEDKFKLTDGSAQDEHQVYKFIRDGQGEIRRFSKRKSGRWVEVGQPQRGGIALSLGFRDAYRDPSF